MTTRAVLYARVSSDDRGKEGRNLASQLEMCRDHAATKGYTIVAELAEDERGASGATLDLPQLNEALEMARGGRYEVFVVREIDRLARNLAKQLILEEELKRAGVELDYVLGEYPDTPEGNLMKNVKASVAEYERLKINERMVRGRRNKARAGHVILHGHAPYGYRRAEVDGKVSLAIDEAEARVVRLLYHWYAVDEMSARAVAIRLAEMGIPTPGRASHGKWQPRTVGLLLDSETYAGVWHYGKGTHVNNPEEQWIPVEVPALVDRATWERTQELRAQGRARSQRNVKYEYLLRWRAFCAGCGTPMVCSSKERGRYLYYRCPVGCGQSKVQSTLICTENRHYRADVVDALVWERVKAWLMDPAELAREVERYQVDRERENAHLHDRLSIVDDKLSQNREKLKRALELYLDGDFEREMLAARRADLDKTMVGLERERADLVATLESASLNQEQIGTLFEFAAQIRVRLKGGEGDFARRRRVIEMLDVKVRLSVEDGGQVAGLTCTFLRKDERLPPIGGSTGSGTSPNRRSRRRPP